MRTQKVWKSCRGQWDRADQGQVEWLGMVTGGGPAKVVPEGCRPPPATFGSTGVGNGEDSLN